MRTVDFFLPIVVVAFFLYVLWSLLSKAGRGKMLGGSIVRSGAEHTISPRHAFSGFQQKLQVHLVQPVSDGQQKLIGIELRSSSFLSLSAVPMTMQIQEAVEFAEEILEMARAGNT